MMYRFFILLVIVPLTLGAAEYPDPSTWDRTIYGFALEDEIIGERKGAIVATGSSSMNFWDHRIHKDLAPLTIISRGFGGSNMNDVLHHLDALVLKHNPRAVMIYEGDNDVAQGVSIENILTTFDATIDRIQKHDAKIRIYLLSIKPSIARAEMWPAMLEVNAALESRAKQDLNLIYIDVATPMLNADGSFRTDLFVTDKLHMNQKGYDIWRNTVAPILIKNEIRYES